MLSAAALFFGVASAVGAQESPSYARQVRPFLAKYCVECHNPKSLKAGLDLSTYKSMLEGSDHGAVLVPGKALESKLVTMLGSKDKIVMPPKSAKFHPTKDEIALVRAWVAAGAKDDSALVKAVIPDIKPHKTSPTPCPSVMFRPDGRLLAVAEYRSVALIDPAAGKWQTRFVDLAVPVTSVAFSPLADSLAIAIGKPGAPADLVLQPLSQRIFVDPPKRKVIHAAHQDSILDVAFSPDSSILATCSYDTRIKLWDILYGAEFREIRTLKEHSDSVYAVAFSPDGKLLASCSADRALKIWDVASGKLLYTMGEATDWLYTLAFAPNGNLACGGVDRSLRVYRIGPDGGKLLQSVFAHEAAVQKVVYSADGKTLYSVGQDRIVKAWDAERMVERKVYDKQPETVLSLSVNRDGTQLALGRYDGVVVLLDTATGKVVHEIAAPSRGASLRAPRVDAALVSTQKSPPSPAPSQYSFPLIGEHEPNNSPLSGQKLTLPATVQGSLEKSGEADFYRFEAAAGYQLGVHLVPGEKAKLEPALQLYDARGRVLAESNEAFLGFTIPEKGWYALGVRDRELRGGAGTNYRVHLGDIPIVAAIFPMGLQRGTEADIRVEGVNLGTNTIRVKANADAAPGSKISLGLKSPRGTPLGNQQVIVGEFAETMPLAKNVIAVPGTGNGRLLKSGSSDVWAFAAKKGQRLIVEVEARRAGSPLDSVIDILDADNRPVERAVLRCLAKTNTTFRDCDSVTGSIRIEVWDELGANDYLFVGSELMRIKALPTHPDADCNFFTDGGQRVGYLDTTPTHHANGVPMYKVGIHSPGTTFPPNGFPVFRVYYRNDDGGPGYGRDSRVFFDPPADGDYRVRIQDARGQGGVSYVYRLTVRPPRPSFNVRFTPANPVVARGDGLPLSVSADRLDGYEGPIHIHFDNVPAGFHLPDTTIQPGDNATAVALFAGADAKSPEAKQPLKLRAHAVVGGQKIVKEASGDAPKVIDPADILAFTEEDQVTLKPGGEGKLTVRIERQKGFAGRVPIDVRGLPHGVRVLDLGLNGILITERETRRTMVIHAEPWVEPMSQPFVVFAKREGKNSEHAAKSVLLKIAR